MLTPLYLLLMPPRFHSIIHAQTLSIRVQLGFVLGVFPPLLLLWEQEMLGQALFMWYLLVLLQQERVPELFPLSFQVQVFWELIFIFPHI